MIPLQRWSASTPVRTLQGFGILFIGVLVAATVFALLGHTPRSGWAVALVGGALSCLIGGFFMASFVEPGAPLWRRR